MKKILIILLFVLCSCSNDNKPITKQTIDNFIAQYKNKDFSTFKNSYIFIKSADITNTVYMIHAASANGPIYVVNFNRLFGKITSIDTIKNKLPHPVGYYKKKELELLIAEFRRLKFCHLGVDSAGNVLVNPFYINNSYFFLKVKDSVVLKKLKILNDFKPYRASWYLSEELAKHINVH